MESLREIRDDELNLVNGGSVSLGFTIAICIEVFAFCASEVYLYNQNKALDRK